MKCIAQLVQFEWQEICMKPQLLCKVEVIPIATNAPAVHPPNNEQEIALPAIFLFRRVSSFLGACIAQDVPTVPFVIPSRKQIIRDITSKETFSLIIPDASIMRSGVNTTKRSSVIPRRYCSATSKIALSLEEEPKRPRTSPALKTVTTRIAYQSFSGWTSIATPGNRMNVVMKIPNIHTKKYRVRRRTCQVF